MLISLSLLCIYVQLYYVYVLMVCTVCVCLYKYTCVLEVYANFLWKFCVYEFIIRLSLFLSRSSTKLTEIFQSYVITRSYLSYGIARHLIGIPCYVLEYTISAPHKNQQRLRKHVIIKMLKSLINGGYFGANWFIGGLTTGRTIIAICERT